jgi:hypothetical protein
MAQYARQEVLVDTQWAGDHLRDPKVRLFEVSVDQGASTRGTSRERSPSTGFMISKSVPRVTLQARRRSNDSSAMPG